MSLGVKNIHYNKVSLRKSKFAKFNNLQTTMIHTHILHNVTLKV